MGFDHASRENRVGFGYWLEEFYRTAIDLSHFDGSTRVVIHRQVRVLAECLLDFGFRHRSVKAQTNHDGYLLSLNADSVEFFEEDVEKNAVGSGTCHVCDDDCYGLPRSYSFGQRFPVW